MCTLIKKKKGRILRVDRWIKSDAKPYTENVSEGNDWQKERKYGHKRNQ